jgi:hypothetical protein
LPVPERRRFWKRLARLRHALRIRRRKPPKGQPAPESPPQPHETASVEAD